MELKEFISCSIQEICEGIAEAKRVTKSPKGFFIVSPLSTSLDVGTENSDLNAKLGSIDFEVLVTSSHQTSSNKSAKVIKIIDAGIGKDNKDSNVKANRIRFSVPFNPGAISSK